MSLLQQMATLGAQVRIREIREEERTLLRLFPVLKPEAKAVALVTEARQKPGRKRPMTVAERRDVSRRMKRYWAEQRRKKR